VDCISHVTTLGVPVHSVCGAGAGAHSLMKILCMAASCPSKRQSNRVSMCPAATLHSSAAVAMARSKSCAL
jgi:hypothetical protein